MSTQQKNGSNGTTKPAANGNGKPVATVVNLPVKKEELKKENPNDRPPVEDRVLKVQQLFDLVTKREKLKESLKKLKSIKASSENRDLKISIEDADNEWETFNTDAIQNLHRGNEANH
jgi:hypothetical protein